MYLRGSKNRSHFGCRLAGGASLPACAYDFERRDEQPETGPMRFIGSEPPRAPRARRHRPSDGHVTKYKCDVL